MGVTLDAQLPVARNTHDWEHHPPPTPKRGETNIEWMFFETNGFEPANNCHVAT
jgi:hypothetical protein